MLTKRIERMLDSNCTRRLRAVLTKPWRQHPTKQLLYGHLLLILKTFQIRRTRLAGYCWRSKDEPISDVLRLTPSHGRAKVERPARTYLQQLCTDTGYSLEDLPRAIDGRDEWQQRVREIHASEISWCWWGWWYMYIDNRHVWLFLLMGSKHFNTDGKGTMLKNKPRLATF